MIYHYCSLDGLIAILSNRLIWASNYKYLNDSKEIELAKQIIDRDLDLVKFPFTGRRGINKVMRCIEEALGDYDYFITSFSKEGDLLSQWRAYAQNGRGVTIGFHENVLSRLPYQILDVLYGTEALIKELTGIINRSLNGTDLDEDELDRLRIEFVALIGRFKSDAFAEEKEKRLIVTSQPNQDKSAVKFRRSGNFIVPYREIHFEAYWSELVGEIIIGPAQKDEDTARSVHFFKHFLGYTSAGMRSSTATFRD